MRTRAGRCVTNRPVRAVVGGTPVRPRESYADSRHQCAAVFRCRGPEQTHITSGNRKSQFMCREKNVYDVTRTRRVKSIRSFENREETFSTHTSCHVTLYRNSVRKRVVYFQTNVVVDKAWMIITFTYSNMQLRTFGILISARICRSHISKTAIRA